MGSESSKTTQSTPQKVIGEWSSGKKIFESDENKILEQIEKSNMRLLTDDSPLHPHEEYMLTIRGEKYAKKLHPITIFLLKQRRQFADNAARTAKVSAKVALEVIDIALPIIISKSKETAKAAIVAKNPQLASVADAVIDSLESQLKLSVKSGTQADVLYKGSGESDYNNVSDYAYLGAADENTTTDDDDNYLGGNDFDGGCGCKGKFIGSADLDITTVSDYAESINSKTKNKIIDEIVETAKKLGLKISGESQHDKIKSMLEQIPAGSRFKRGDEIHKKTCIGIAKAINSIHGNSIINESMSPEIICQQVAEIVSSLGAGMHTEFLAVYNDVRKVLKNLHILKNALKDDHEAIVNRIANSDDSTLSQQVTTLNDLHKIIIEEIDRQIQLLSNLLNVTLFPAEKDLALLIKNKKDIHGYIEKIDVKIGSEKFGKVISDILKGLGITANFALLIERALKTVGITLDEYKKSNSTKTLRDKIIQNIMGKDLDESQRHEYLEAAELLYKNLYRSAEIADKLKTQKTGRFESEYDGAGERYTGSDDYTKTTTDKRIRDRKKLRNLLFDAFYKQLSDYFDQFVNSLDQLTLKVGTEIPLSDQLDGFRQILQRISDALNRNKNIYYALIGYYNDAMSKSKKDELIGNLKMVSSYINTILEISLYKSSAQYFKSVQDHIEAIITLIDKYSDEVAVKFGRHEDPAPSCIYLEKTDSDDLVTGADESDNVYGGIDTLEREPVIKYRSSKSIHDAVRQFDYKYRVAQIRAHMNATGKELAHYSEKYEKIIANSIADILQSDKKCYEKLSKELDHDKFGKYEDYKVADVVGFSKKENVAAERNAAKRFLDSQWEAKKKFWATIEAVDTYMRVFTDGLVKNPNDIKEIKIMLDEIEIINEWYNDTTGNILAGVFDYFPSFIQGESLTTDTNANPNKRKVLYPDQTLRNENETSNTHYYQRISNLLEKNRADMTTHRREALPGNPYLVTIPTWGERAKNQVKKTFTGLAVLKNLLSIFVSVGSKFGGEELRKKVFMTPAQMYNNLIEYLQASAFAQGWGLGQILPNNDLPDEFSTSKDLAIQLDIITGDVIGLSTESGYAIEPDGTPIIDWNNQTYQKSLIVHLGVSAQDDRAISANYAKRLEKAQIAQMAANATAKTLNEVGDELTEKIREEVRSGLMMVDTQSKPETWKKPQNTKLEDMLDEHMPLDPYTNKKISVPQPTRETNEDRILIFKKRWGIWMRSVIKDLRTRDSFGFNREDDYFVMILKSIAAKIFTVTGMYDVLDRPMEFNGLNPIRMITGGNTEIPKIDDGAVALYLRLPLLAQFYRGIFGWDNEQEVPFTTYDELQRKDNTVKISMVPDVDGVFAGLIRLIFRKTKYVDSTSYSDDDVKEIVREVNLIYQRMQSKYPQNTVMETIYEFVAEINRRYGIVSKTERDDYEREFGYRYDYSITALEKREGVTDRYNSPPDTEIAILPGETDDEIQRPSAAQKLLGESFNSSTDKKHPFTITEQHRKLVYKFRCAFDKYFENPDEEHTFNNAIKTTQLKLKRETRTEERFKLITSLIRGVDIYNKVDGLKYVMFHETVVSGLNLLSAMHSMLSRFKLRAHLLDVRMLEEELWKYFGKSGKKKTAELLARVRTHLENSGITYDTDFLSNYVINIFGYHEAAYFNGGHNEGHDEDMYNIKAIDGVPVTNNNKEFVKIPRWVGNKFGVIDLDSTSDAIHENYKVKKGLAFTSNASVGTNVDPDESIFGGLNSILCGWGVTQLHDAYNNSRKNGKNQTEESKVANTFMRFIFNREFMMKELLETVFGVSNDFQGLVDIKIDDGRLFLNYSGLKTLINDMFQHINYFLELLRPHIKPEIIKKYTDKLTPGSYYWLQEQLIEKIIVGRPAANVPLVGEEPNLRVGYANFDELVQKLSYTYEFLTRKWNIDGAKLLPYKKGLRSRTNPATPDTECTSYDKVFAEMIFYDAAKEQSGIIRAIDANEVDDDNNSISSPKIIDYINNPYDALHFAGPHGNKFLDSRYIARFYQLYSWKTNVFTMNRSALFAFNQLIAKFIQAFYDPVSGKIYGNLINQFTNGPFNRAISDTIYTYPDTIALLNIKIGPPGEMKIPNTIPLLASINHPVFVQQLPLFENIVIQYLTYGVKQDDKDNRYHREKLLYPDGEIATMVECPFVNDINSQSEVPNGSAVPLLYVYLVGHILAKVIHNIFEHLAGTSPQYKSEGSTDLTSLPGGNRYTNAVSDVLNAALFPNHFDENEIQNVTLNKMITTYSGKEGIYPTLENIIYKIFTGNTNNLVKKINAIVVLTSDEDVNMYNAFTYDPGNLLNDFINKNPTPNYIKYVGSVVQQYSELIINLLRIPNRPPPLPGGLWKQTTENLNTYGHGVLLAAKIFPMNNNAIGRNDEETKYNAKIYAGILARLAQDWDNILNRTEGSKNEEKERTRNQTLWNESLDKIYSSVSRVSATYALPAPERPTTLVKYDDAILSDTDNAFSRTIHYPSSKGNLFIAARAEEISGIIGPDSVKNFLGRNDINHDITDDDIDYLSYFGRRCDPDADHILFSSLAIILKNIMGSRNPQTQAMLIIQDNIADVPLHIKEKMRANLPAFRNLFKELVTRCEFLKKYMNRPEMNMRRSYEHVYTKDSDDNLAKAGPHLNPWPYGLKCVVDTGSDITKNSFTGILDSIIRGSQSLISGCEQVLREVGDDPKYFELYQNSIKDYKMQYGIDPLMPLSSTLAILKNVNDKNYTDFLPFHSLGEDKFKFMYGTRSILGQPTNQPLLEHNPGYSQMIEQYNLLVDTTMQIDKSKADAFHKSFVKMLRYIYELKHIKSVLTPNVLIPGEDIYKINMIDPTTANETLLHIDGSFMRDDLILTKFIRGSDEIRLDDGTRLHTIHDGNKPGVVYITNKSDISIINDDKNRDKVSQYPTAAYSIVKSLAETIKLTESSFRDDKIKEIVEHLVGGSKPRNRLEIQNIIDLNIVPINVHALMREIPLANLYNYSYTFDRLIIELYYGLKNNEARKLIADLCDDNTGKLSRITSAKDMLVALLLQPYMEVWSAGTDGENYYEKYVKSMLVGVANNGELGRPKFLSDQVYNKVLFGEVYVSRDDYNEMGPAAGRITRVHLDKNQLIRTITLILKILLYSLCSADSRFEFIICDGYLSQHANNGKTIRYNQDSIKRNEEYVNMIITAFTDHAITDPSCTVEEMIKKLDTQTTIARLDKKFYINPNKNNRGYKTALTFTALCTKLIAWSILGYVDELNNRTDNKIIREIKDYYMTELFLNLTMLYEIGSNHIANSPFLGIIRPTGSAPGSADEAVWNLMDNHFGYNIINTYPDFRYDVKSKITLDAKYGIDNKSLRKFEFKKKRWTDLRNMMKRILGESKFYINLNNKPSNTLDNRDFLLAIQPFINVPINVNKSVEPIEYTVNKQYLHWLSTAEDSLTQQDTDNNDSLNIKQIKSVDVTEIKQELAIVGRLRFDTIFIRNLIFIVNLYRSVRMKLQRDLIYNKDIIQRSASITSAQLTEFFGNQVYRDRQTLANMPAQLWSRYTY